MVQVLDWQSADDTQEIVQCAVQALGEGQFVVFPTETVYGIAASALVPDAVARLPRSPDSLPFLLAIRGAGDALDWVPGISVLGRRLARRCWPGPVTLVFGDSVERGLASRLPEQVREQVCPDGTLGLRTPAHDALLQALSRLPGPLVLGELPDAVTAEQALQQLGDQVGLLLDDGACRYGRASSVVQVNGNHWQMLREGVVPPDLIQRQCQCLIVFVCTGNTCRSPLAEALCKQLLAERLGCSSDELPQRGFLVVSAGISAMMGGAAAVEAIAVASDLGADLSRHRSRPLTPDLVAQADHLLTMTRDHLLAVVHQFPQAGTAPQLLSPDGTDVPDPIGGERPVYEECARQIRSHLQELVNRLPLG
jgi:tRNA threonylcarbamoyl adenosine modification protein (Sua5/YciO/YrdC/YwlC family)